MDLTQIFCDVDDFYQVFEPEWLKNLVMIGLPFQPRRRKLVSSEVMTREFELKREAHLHSYANIERRFLGYHRITDQTRQKMDEKVVGTTMSCVVDLANIF